MLNHSWWCTFYVVVVVVVAKRLLEGAGAGAGVESLWGGNDATGLKIFAGCCCSCLVVIVVAWCYLFLLLLLVVVVVVLLVFLCLVLAFWLLRGIKNDVFLLFGLVLYKVSCSCCCCS